MTFHSPAWRINQINLKYSNKNELVSDTNAVKDANK
jgi:hypothetical protein